jgi:hypothetical protein
MSEHLFLTGTSGAIGSALARAPAPATRKLGLRSST